MNGNEKTAVSAIKKNRVRSWCERMRGAVVGRRSASEAEIAGRQALGMYILLFIFFFGLRGSVHIATIDCPSTQEREPLVLVEYYRVLVFVLV